MNWLIIVLLILANYRLARLIAVDDGPNDWLFKLRANLGGYDLDEQGFPDTSLGRGIICAHCVGIWTGLILSLGYTTVYHFNWQWSVLLIFYTLVISGGQSLLWSLSNDS